MRDLTPVFEPRSIAIIGANSNPQSITNLSFTQQLLSFGYPGRIYPVNPRAEEVLGLKAYASIGDIPEPVDYVICAVPSPAAPQIMRECVAARARVVSLFTAGFSEVGEGGAALEAELVRIAREGGVLLVGPNCLGVHCPKAGMALDGSIPRNCGHIGFVSQSGGVCTEMVQALAERDLYVSKLISLGNAADLNESDYLEYLGADDDTRIIGAYVEGIREPGRFLKTAREVSRKKPLLVLKGGRTPSGAGAVRLHTGSLAGSVEIWDTLCRQAGILQVHGLREMTDAMQAFTYLKPPKGRRVGIVGVGGGFGVLATDDCVRAGLVVPELSEGARAELRKYNPEAGTGLRNPVDTPATNLMDPRILSATVRAVGACPGIDLVFVSFPTLFGVRMAPESLTEGFRMVAEASREMDKPAVIILSTSNCAEAETRAWELQKRCLEQGAPVYLTFEQAARAVNHVISYHERQRGFPVLY
jgi:acyl-CoA synthetase (NDP forming)